MDRIASYERELSAALIGAIQNVAGGVIYGIADPERLGERVPTVSFTVDGVTPSGLASALSDAGFGVRSGHMYSPRLMNRLGVMPEGLVRVSLVHYNTVAEIARFGEALSATVESLRRTPVRV